MGSHSADPTPSQGNNPPVQPPRTITLFVYVGVLLVLALCTAVGSVLLEIPNLPSGFLGWIEALFGASLLVFTALVVPFLSKIVGIVAKRVNVGSLKRFGKAIRKRDRLVAIAVTVPVLVLAAVLIPEEEPDGELEPGGLTIMSAFDESPSDPRRMLINQWNQAHPANPVTIIDAPGEPDEQHGRMVGEAMKGDRGEADVYVLDIVWMAEFIAKNWIQPLDESRRISRDTDFMAKALDTCRDTYGNREGLWALPFNTDAGLLYSRTDLLGAVPLARWEDYFGETAKRTYLGVKNSPGIAGDRVAKLESANVAQLADEETLTIMALEAIWAAGGEVVNPDGKLVLNQDASAVRFDNNALEGLRALAAAVKDPEQALPDPRQYDEDGAVDAFADGRTLFMRNWPVAYDKLMQASDPDANSFDVRELPHSSVLGGQNLAISRWTDKPRAAQALIEFLANPSSQMILFAVGGFAPVQQSVYEDFQGATRPYLSAIRSAVDRARPRPATPCYTEWSVEFRKGIDRALRADGEIEEDFPRILAEIAACNST